MAGTSTLIVTGVRTPMGAFMGSLAGVPAAQLGATCVKALVERTGIPAGAVDELIFGTCIGAGQGMNPARQVAVFGGLDKRTHALTVNEACASGMRAVMLADQIIRLGEAGVAVAGGMENMSRPPYMLLKGREGYRLGNAEVVDALMHDGLTDAYSNKPMGVFADQCAAKYEVSRQAQDDFAVESHARARKAVADGVFAEEIAPVSIVARGKTTVVAEDEGLNKFDEAKMRGLRAAFNPEGTVTAGNASSINDGAAALLLASPARCESLGLRPRARIVAACLHSQEPEWFTTAPVGAVQGVLEKAGWNVSDVDLFELNEAFAVVALTCGKQLGLPAERTNIYGGAVPLGHPIGCSGARLLVTLLTGLKHTGGRRGVAALCVGGGEGIAMAVEAV
ncbi:Acetyl-CoA acetyltransferase [Aquisphaera giovannonii]|uniref:Acetyl-CoA acetyltransferase n=1 Tax=Aquisphaera giovannonii TaxID=406548 RepID=A0A5B9W3G6_9BACT|nr:thiolase family protein [Aquisphaera giovannonii]QEH35156.1 Acetyl-CoA acetyltransferase [Aquisphaera giovannonii]